LFLGRRIKLVITIHDVIYLLPATVVPPGKTLREKIGRTYRSLVVPRVASRAECILADSHCTKADIVECLRIDSSTIRVIYPGVSQDSRGPLALSSQVTNRTGIGPETRFVLAQGGNNPRKNTEMIIRVYAGLRRSREISEKLVVTGVLHGGSSPFHKLVCQLGLLEDVIFTGYVSDEDMRWLYCSARCFLYPSLYEGFGFPPLEAMACGTPVVASRRASLPEVVGEAALLIDPTSSESMREALPRVLRDETLRKELASRGRLQAAKFRWETTVEQTLAAYREVLGT
jgi:glycosyltransferase involved in cell wall biosynthesis